uniref:Serpentine Receptor, class H n=1 Tax=Caenorhabditis tropicalis TaxID=1561998 RepID=A0A1I7UWQ7_9PELO
MLFLSAGIAPILHTPSWGFKSTGFLQLFDTINPMWSIISTVYCHLIMLFFLVQVINTRCEVIQKLSVVAYEEEQKMFLLIRTLLKVFYFFILFSFWCLLLTLGFGEGDSQKRLRQTAEKTKAKGLSCPNFFFLDTDSWRLILSIISIVFLLITFLIFSIGYLSGAYHILKKSKMKISKKFWKIQTGFLWLSGIQVTLLFCFLLFLPICFLALKAPGSESISLTILLFTAHHGTVSTVVFIVAHRFVRSRILRVYNNCVPKAHRVGTVLDADRLDTHSVPQTQVFAVITDNTSV